MFAQTIKFRNYSVSKLQLQDIPTFILLCYNSTENYKRKLPILYR